MSLEDRIMEVELRHSRARKRNVLSYLAIFISSSLTLATVTYAITSWFNAARIDALQVQVVKERMALLEQASIESRLATSVLMDQIGDDEVALNLPIRGGFNDFSARQLVVVRRLVDSQNKSNFNLREEVLSLGRVLHANPSSVVIAIPSENVVSVVEAKDANTAKVYPVITAAIPNGLY